MPGGDQRFLFHFRLSLPTDHKHQFCHDYNLQHFLIQCTQSRRKYNFHLLVQPVSEFYDNLPEWEYDVES